MTTRKSSEKKLALTLVVVLFLLSLLACSEAQFAPTGAVESPAAVATLQPVTDTSAQEPEESQNIWEGVFPRELTVDLDTDLVGGKCLKVGEGFFANLKARAPYGFETREELLNFGTWIFSGYTLERKVKLVASSGLTVELSQGEEYEMDIQIPIWDKEGSTKYYAGGADLFYWVPEVAPEPGRECISSVKGRVITLTRRDE